LGSRYGTARPPLTACSPKLRPVVVTALQTGLRWNELVSLAWDTINLEERILTVKACYSKNHQEGVVPLNEVALKTLAAIKPAHATGRLFGYHEFSPPFQDAARKAGLPDVTPHTLRHTFATRLLVAGVPLALVKQLIRHSSITMTMRYSHAVLGDLRDAVERLGQPSD
jgi:integrase